MFHFNRFVRIRIGLLLLTISSVISGCATTGGSSKGDGVSQKTARIDAKKAKYHRSTQSSDSYALLDDKSDVDQAILKRGARARGTDFGY